MTLAEYYDAGYADGEQEGDHVLAEGLGLVAERDTSLREDATVALSNRILGPTFVGYAAYCLGVARGFRSIVR